MSIVVFVLIPLAQASDGFPWKDVIGASGLSAWVVMAGLFVADKIRTTAGATREIDAWRELYKQQVERADKAEERMLQSLQIVRKGVEATEKALSAATQQQQKGA
jgi:hypothetical protein